MVDNALHPLRVSRNRRNADQPDHSRVIYLEQDADNFEHAVYDLRQEFLTEVKAIRNAQKQLTATLVAGILAVTADILQRVL